MSNINNCKIHNIDVWGEIYGDIKDQKDLMELVEGRASKEYVDEKIEEVEEKIPDVSGKADKTYVDSEIARVEGEIPSLDGYATEEYVDGKIEEVEGEIPSLDGYATEEYVDNGLATKQDTLTAGENITIEDNVISAAGGGVVYHEWTMVTVEDEESDSHEELHPTVEQMNAAITDFGEGKDVRVIAVYDTGDEIYRAIVVNAEYIEGIYDFYMIHNVGSVTLTYDNGTYSYYERDFASQESIDEKQDVLVSGENIKTINGEDILGEGDIEIQGGLSPEELEKLEPELNPQVGYLKTSGLGAKSITLMPMTGASGNTFSWSNYANIDGDFYFFGDFYAYRYNMEAASFEIDFEAQGRESYFPIWQDHNGNIYSGFTQKYNPDTHIWDYTEWDLAYVSQGHMHNIFEIDGDFYCLYPNQTKVFDENNLTWSSIDSNLPEMFNMMNVVKYEDKLLYIQDGTMYEFSIENNTLTLITVADPYFDVYNPANGAYIFELNGEVYWMQNDILKHWNGSDWEEWIMAGNYGWWDKGYLVLMDNYIVGGIGFPQGMIPFINVSEEGIIFNTSWENRDFVNTNSNQRISGQKTFENISASNINIGYWNGDTTASLGNLNLTANNCTVKAPVDITGSCKINGNNATTDDKIYLNESETLWGNKISLVYDDTNTRYFYNKDLWHTHNGRYFVTEDNNEGGYVTYEIDLETGEVTNLGGNVTQQLAYGEWNREGVVISSEGDIDNGTTYLITYLNGAGLLYEWNETAVAWEYKGQLYSNLSEISYFWCADGYLYYGDSYRYDGSDWSFVTVNNYMGGYPILSTADGTYVLTNDMMYKYQDYDGYIIFEECGYINPNWNPSRRNVFWFNGDIFTWGMTINKINLEYAALHRYDTVSSPCDMFSYDNAVGEVLYYLPKNAGNKGVYFNGSFKDTTPSTKGIGRIYGIASTKAEVPSEMGSYIFGCEVGATENTYSWNKLIWTGTQAEWDALDASEQASYKIALITE